MSLNLILPELIVVLLGLGVLLADLWVTAERRRFLSQGAAAGVLLLLLASFAGLFPGPDAGSGFSGMILKDGLAVFFERLFLLAGAVVLLLQVEFSDQIATGHSEYTALSLFALAGMMLAASANDFVMLFVSLELITVTFYVLVSFQRGRSVSLEAGVKYLILGALSSAFLLYGIALVFGAANSTRFPDLAQSTVLFGGEAGGQRIAQLGLLLILAGLSFKVAVFPFQMWTPDVYQGAPVPTTAFLAVGSKAAGFVLLLRIGFGVFPAAVVHWHRLFVGLAAVTILYGSLCAIPQRSVKRLLGYSSIANAGYLLLGLAAHGPAGASSMLYFLAGYVVTTLTAFTVLTVVVRHTQADDLDALSGLAERSPVLGGALTLAMVSLAGIPPLAGFTGKFFLFKSALEQAPRHHGLYFLTGVAVLGVLISIYYYFGVVRVIYAPRVEGGDRSTIPVSLPMRACLGLCAVAILALGILPAPVWDAAAAAVRTVATR